MDYAETKAYGITQKSTKFVKEQLPRLGSIVQIECLLAGDTHLDLGDEQWVAFIDEKGDRIVVSGFSWGYAGEGPHGLLKMAQELGFDLGIETIAHYPRNEYWTIHRERMKLTEDLADYIIVLQGIADRERGLDGDELVIQHKLELEFPNLKWERERQEFNQWLWGTRTEAEPDVIEARVLMGHDIPFDEVYHADKFGCPDAEDSTYNLYREHTEVAGDIFQETKQAAKSRLAAQDKSGEIDLKKEWQIATRR